MQGCVCLRLASPALLKLLLNPNASRNPSQARAQADSESSGSLLPCVVLTEALNPESLIESPEPGFRVYL